MICQQSHHLLVQSRLSRPPSQRSIVARVCSCKRRVNVAGSHCYCFKPSTHIKLCSGKHETAWENCRENGGCKHSTSHQRCLACMVVAQKRRDWCHWIVYWRRKQSFASNSRWIVQLFCASHRQLMMNLHTTVKLRLCYGGAPMTDRPTRQRVMWSILPNKQKHKMKSNWLRPAHICMSTLRAR